MTKMTTIDIGSHSNKELIDICYKYFKEDMLKKENRPLLFGKNIYMPIEWNQNKAEAFWHASSMEPKDNLTIYPCNNDYSYSLCDNNCINKNHTITLKNGDIRILCYYRMVRVHWIKTIIDLVNQGDPKVQCWEKIKKGKQTNLYIRYIYQEIDYVVIFAKKTNQYTFITAYPVFFIDSKIEFTKDYEKYIKKPVIAMRKPGSPSTLGR